MNKNQVTMLPFFYQEIVKVGSTMNLKTKSNEVDHANIRQAK